jgi:CotH kinase protein
VAPSRVHVQPERGIEAERKVPGRMTLPGFDGSIGIEVRGQWSRRLPKKSYSLELRNPGGENLDVPLLGMPADDDWVLYAAYNDRTLMRNVLAYETSRWMGRWAARSRFVSLYVRGGYRGLYVLMEKPKLHRHRLAGGDGAFLLELTTHRQAARKDPSFRAPVTRRPFVWADPERRDLSAAQAERIRRAVARTERSLYRGRPGAWRRHLHAPSTIDHFLLNELFKNQDGMNASTFLSGDTGRRLRLGPIWDFDMTMGATRQYPGRLLEGWTLANRPWAEPLYRDRAFMRAMGRRWQELRRGGLERRLLRRIGVLDRRLAAAARRDSARWPAGGDRPRGARETHVHGLRRWLTRRIDWLDRNL